MNRTIKFRAWDGEKIIYEFIVAKPQYVNCLSIMTDEEFAIQTYNSVKEWKVMQFTGLYDREGKEVWEGDVLEIWIENIKQDNLYTVEKSEELYFEMNREDSYYRFTQVKVLGNIYENSNLLQ